MNKALYIILILILNNALADLFEDPLISDQRLGHNSADENDEISHQEMSEHINFNSSASDPELSDHGNFGNYTDATDDISDVMEGEELYTESEGDLYMADLDIGAKDDDNNEPKIVQKPQALVVRCSRRFSPGNCREPVSTVWTYVFELQNCTERLGCLYAARSNRFKSYNRCNRMCMQLSNVYSTVLEMENIHRDVNNREYGLPRRSGGIQWNKNKDVPNLPPLSDTYSDNEGRPTARDYYDFIERHKSLYDDYGFANGADEFLVPPDLDEFRVAPGVSDDFHNNY